MFCQNVSKNFGIRQKFTGMEEKYLKIDKRRIIFLDYIFIQKRYRISGAFIGIYIDVEVYQTRPVWRKNESKSNLVLTANPRKRRLKLLIPTTSSKCRNVSSVLISLKILFVVLTAEIHRDRKYLFYFLYYFQSERFFSPHDFNLL